MNWFGIDRLMSRRLLLPVIGIMIFIFASQANAATLIEIVAMDEAGIPPEVIIEVIEATGLDDPLDYDAIEFLAERGVSEIVLDFLIGEDTEYRYVEFEDADELPSDYDISDHPNWAGGEGFHRGGSGYNPLDNRDRGYDYWDGPSYRDNNFYYGPGYGVTVYEPPVYVYDRNYRGYYRAPRMHHYNRGYWNGNYYVMYDRDYHEPYNYVSPYYYNDYWSWPGDGYRDGRRYYGDSRYYAGYHSDGLSLRISF